MRICRVTYSRLDLILLIYLSKYFKLGSYLVRFAFRKSHSHITGQSRGREATCESLMIAQAGNRRA